MKYCTKLKMFFSKSGRGTWYWYVNIPLFINPLGIGMPVLPVSSEPTVWKVEFFDTYQEAQRCLIENVNKLTMLAIKYTKEGLQ